MKQELIRPANTADLHRLLPLMRGYYRVDGLNFDESQARAIMSRLLSEPQWGCAILAEVDDHAVGYIVLCMGFSLELGGGRRVHRRVVRRARVSRPGHRAAVSCSA